MVSQDFDGGKRDAYADLAAEDVVDRALLVLDRKDLRSKALVD
jgi:hypothetical protein